MRLVVKIGGTLIQEDEARMPLALQIGGVMAAGHQVLVVHGGGAQLTAYLKRTGVEATFVEGRRVTSPQVLDAAVKVMGGSVSHELLATFASAGVAACGISGVDGGCLLASRRNGAGLDLGLVGSVEAVQTHLFDALAAGGFVPVLAPLGVTRNGQILNINADEVAVACAAAWMADRLIFLTDVEGVRDGDGVIAPLLSPLQIEHYIRAGIATGGMLAKLRAASAALAKGVPQVEIASGREPRIVRRLLQNERIGTSVRKDSTRHEAGAHA